MALDAVVRWALQPDPRARPSAAELSAALGRFLADPYGTSNYVAVQPQPPTTSAKYGQSPDQDQELSTAGRLGWIAALIGLFVLVLAGVLLFLVIVAGAGGATPTRAPLAGATPSPGPTPTARPTRFAAPAFVGLTIAVARQLADGVGLILDEEARQTDEAPPGTILEQDPLAGKGIRPGATVHVLVAQRADTIAVPDVRGETEERALADLVDAGLVPGGRFRAYDPRTPAGKVLRTDPSTGTTVARGTTVAYTLSRGPRPRPTPTSAPSTVLVGNYRCVDLDHVRMQIEDAGMVVGKVVPGSPDSDGSWLVQDQDPAPGAEVDQGTTIRLTVTDPAEPCT